MGLSAMLDLRRRPLSYLSSTASCTRRHPSRDHWPVDNGILISFNPIVAVAIPAPVIFHLDGAVEQIQVSERYSYRVRIQNPPNLIISFSLQPQLRPHTLPTILVVLPFRPLGSSVCTSCSTPCFVQIIPLHHPGRNVEMKGDVHAAARESLTKWCLLKLLLIQEDPRGPGAFDLSP